jgi:disulfide oxidoreductase YuzD
MMSNLWGSEVIRQSCVNAPITEEPYERIVHVRISGGRWG